MLPKRTMTADEDRQLLAERATRLAAQRPPALDPMLRAVHFLRGVASLAGMTLPAYYLYVGSRIDGEPPFILADHPGAVAKDFLESSSLNYLTLAARQSFDHKVSSKKALGSLTGKNFGKSTDSTLEAMAVYWAQNGHPIDEARAALRFLRAVFDELSGTDEDLLKSPSVLARRIGLLKQHGDRTAAHLSLESHELSTLDCAHVAAVLATLGAIITSFDDPTISHSYFDSIDASAASAARQLFPGAPNTRLFEGVSLELLCRQCWERDIKQGRELLEHLHATTSFW